MRYFALVALLSAVLANGALLRNAAPEKPAAKVKHLILDIEESISKAGGDAEMAFATLYTYDGQLEASLEKEIGTLGKTLIKLKSMQKRYSVDLNKSHTKFATFGSDAHDSAVKADKYKVGTSATQSRFEGLQNNVEMLIALLKNAGITAQGKLVTPEAPDARGEPARVYSAIRRLLTAYSPMRVQHPDVYEAFLPKSAAVGKYPPVRMTDDLLQQVITALASVKGRLSSMKATALVQFDSLHRRFEKEAVFAGASAEAQLGLEAENEQKAAELTFSIRFTTAVLAIDQKFYDSVKNHVKSNADLIYAIRDLRHAQLKSVRDLTGILSAEGSIGIASKLPGLSFLEISSPFAGLQTEAESVIRNHGDTHAVLMRLKAELDESSPIDAGSVQSTVIEMENVLRSVETDQSKFDEAKRHCESQKFHADEEQESLKANLALMTAARDHAEKAMKAAVSNVKGIQKKSQALEKSSKDFARISMQALKALEGQSRDRATIQMAVKKAADVVGPSLPAGGSTVQLMQSLIQDMQFQEAKESTYRANQEQFQAEFSRYVQDYGDLLADRHRHYGSSISVLELHVSELASDLLAQQQTLSTSHELTVQSEGLCESVLKFYHKHTKTRADLSAALRKIIPNMPTVLSQGAINA